MSVNAIESADAQPVAQTQNNELIYRLEDRPPLPQTFFAACQHLLAMFVAVITPALLICQALGLPAQDTQHIISMSLFASGVASIIQIKAWGPVGSGLLSIQGTSFNFVAPLIMGGTALKTGGADVPTMMAALFGTLMLASCTEMVLSRILHLARRIITPLVSGVVVMIIGLSLIQVGLTSIGGGYAAMSDNTFGAPKNLLLAGSSWPLSSCLIVNVTPTCAWLLWLSQWRQAIFWLGLWACCLRITLRSRRTSS
ncbi:uracil-xanthine permease [Salmonella enterica subsp. arizonae]|nr:uracil-xanthine permease [Salmonella enterica subsp. arizonae]